MTIAAFLDLSTRYMTQNDAELLFALINGDDAGDLVVNAHPHGWFVHVEQDADRLAELSQTLRKVGYSEAFINLLRYARERECWWINFDSGGEDEDGLPTFDW